MEKNRKYIALGVLASVLAMGIWMVGRKPVTLGRPEHLGRDSGGANVSERPEISSVPVAGRSTDIVDKDTSEASLSAGFDTLDLSAQTPKRPIVLNSDERQRRNILERQADLRIQVAVLRGTAPLPEGHTFSGVATSAIVGAVETIFDAEGRALYAPRIAPDASKEERRAFSKFVDEGWVLPKESAHRFGSGGALYEIPFGEYPELDQILDLDRQYGLHIPIDLIPLSNIITHAEQALSYTIGG